MRLLAAIPLVLSFTSFILTVLCLFAGGQKGFMEDFDIVTVGWLLSKTSRTSLTRLSQLNISRIGQNFLENSTSSSSSSSSSNDSWWSEIKGNISSDISAAESALETALSNTLTSIAHDLNLYDFYSMHVLDFCEGYYTPAPVPNATLPASHIFRNVTACSNHSGFAHFVPSKYLARELNHSSLGEYVNLTTLHWPTAIDRSFHAVQTAASAVFVLYCIAIALTALVLIAAGIDLLLSSSTSNVRWPVLVQIGISVTALIALVLASALTTAIADKVAHAVNKYGAYIGVMAKRGTKILALTWVATGMMAVVVVMWGWVVWRQRNGVRRGEKAEYA